jgi:hypothetical protein
MKGQISQNFDQANRFRRISTHKRFCKATLTDGAETFKVATGTTSDEISDFVAPYFEFERHQKMAQTKELFVSMESTDCP